eukprot:3503978-Prymnesium_polylepis.3
MPAGEGCFASLSRGEAFGRPRRRLRRDFEHGCHAQLIVALCCSTACHASRYVRLRGWMWRDELRHFAREREALLGGFAALADAWQELGELAGTRRQAPSLRDCRSHLPPTA